MNFPRTLLTFLLSQNLLSDSKEMKKELFIFLFVKVEFSDFKTNPPRISSEKKSCSNDEKFQFVLTVKKEVKLQNEKRKSCFIRSPASSLACKIKMNEKKTRKLLSYVLSNKFHIRVVTL